MNVGFIGLGTMGQRMARNIAARGFPLTVHDVRPGAGDDLVGAGASWADTPAALAAVVDVVFTSLPGPQEVEEVAYGADGLAESLSPGTPWFDLTTNSPTVVRRIHADLATRDVPFLDAPVSGGPAGAASGRLALWIGGDAGVIERCAPVLAAFSDRVHHAGPIGAGSITKLVHNCSGYILQTALAEVFTLGVKAGVDPLELFAAVRQGAFGRRRTYDGLVDQFLPNRYDPPSFALRLAHKDVSLATQLGRELGVPMRLANLTLEEMTEALGRGWGELDSRVPMRLQLERAGVDIEVPVADIARIVEDDR